MKLWIDLETFSPVPIKHGTHAYAQGSEILLIAWAIDDADPQVVDLTATGGVLPVALAHAMADPEVEIWAHNSSFDRTILNRHAYGTPINRWRDTMAQALSHGLPGSLAQLCEALGLDADQAKGKDGKALMRLFCMPRPKKSLLRRATRETHPEQWGRFVEYAGRDIVAMRECHKRMPTWNWQPADIALWHLDQRINDRGFTVDVELAEGAIQAAEQARAALAAQCRDQTGGMVESATQRDALLAYVLGAHGVALPDLRKSTIERLLADGDMPEPVRDLLATRVQASATASSKYQVVIDAQTGGRLRGTMQFRGASRTGRWAGRLFQPQNLPRPSHKQAQIDLGIEAIKAGCADLIVDDVMPLLGSCVRGVIVAPLGKKLVVADLSNIEGRILAWLAGEDWKVAAYREGVDLYVQAYARAFGIDSADVTKAQRQIGKVMELALGYQGGVGAFVTFAAVYGIDLEALGAQAFDTIPAAAREGARSALEWAKREKRPTFGLSDRAWIVCDSFKRLWRDAHPAVASLWADLDAAIRIAIRAPGTWLAIRAPRDWKPCRKLAVRRDGAWLRIRLPSGRSLCYPGIREADDGQLSYMGVNQYTRKWGRIKTYGGKLVENAVQAVAADVLSFPLPTIESAGYEIVLSVHDELLTESADGTHEELSALMSTGADWAEGLPLAAAGFESTRYRKD